MKPLTDAEMAAISAPDDQSPTLQQGVPTGPLTDAQMAAAMTVPAGEGPGLMESFGRGALEGATFGFDDEIGLQDAARREASRRANPWTHFMGEMAGGVLPMVAAAPLAGVRGVGLAAQGARGVARMLAPGPMNTLGQAAGQGAKLGAVYGGLSGAGHADATNPNESVAASALRRGTGAVVGAGLGTALGVPLGAAGHGASRLLGAAINRLSPEMRDVLEAARNPESQGVRDVMRALGYDQYTMEDLAAVRAALNDPAQAHRYADLNLVEALETRPVQPQAGSGELRPPVVTSPNLRDIAQDFANTGGQGRQEAVEAFATRRNDMSSRIQNDVDRLIDPARPPSAAGDIDNLTTAIDANFGSGNRAQVEAGQAAQRTAYGRRYDRLRDQPLVLSEDIGPNIQSLPTFQRAMAYAAENDLIRDPSSPIRGLWSQNALGETSLTLSPNNILDIHHALVMAAKPPIGGATPESVMAGRLKQWFSGWADRQLRGHKPLRTEYERFKRTLEAQDRASTLGINRGGDDALTFFDGALGRLNQSGQALQRATAQYDAALQRYQQGLIRTPPKATNINQNIAAVEAEQEIVDAFRRTWGERLKQELAQSGDTGTRAFLRDALTPEGRRRILHILGRNEGPRFLDNLLVLEGRNQGLGLGLKAGGSDHAALRFFDQAVREGRDEVADSFRRGWAERIRQELAQSPDPNQVVRSLLTQEGKSRILRILGDARGTEFIETLYNKQTQMGLSKTLFGNSDTAYKLARNKKMDALMDVIHGLQPWSFRPGQVWSGIREIGSAAYKQRRADQGNLLLSQQGPARVGSILDTILARNQLQTSGHPYIMNPGAKLLGPAASAEVGSIFDRYTERPRRREP